MAQLDDIVGSFMKKIDDLGVADDTILVFTTDNGAENFTWPDGGQTPFAGAKGTVLERRMRAPCIRAMAGQGAGPAGSRTASSPGLDLVPRPSSPRPEIPASSTSWKKGKGARRHDLQRSTSTATTRPT